MQCLHEKLLNTCHRAPLGVATQSSTEPPPPFIPIPYPPKPSHSHTYIYISLFPVLKFAINSICHSNMAEAPYQPLRYQQQYQISGHQQQPRYTQVVKAATAITAGGSLLILAGLMLAGTVIALTIAMPLFVIFSPVLVPAAMALALLTLGFLASGGFGVAAITVLAWIYRYVTGKHPPGADQLDTARHKLMNKAREIKDYGQQQFSTGPQAS